jgi:hypothetical protein
MHRVDSLLLELGIECALSLAIAAAIIWMASQIIAS